LKLLVNVGGRGTRLKTVTADLPKPMVAISGRPLMEYTVEWARMWGFSEVVMLCHYRHEVFASHFGDGSAFGIPISYSIEPRALGSGGSIRYALPDPGEAFACINGDLLCRVHFQRMRDAHEQAGADMTVLFTNLTMPMTATSWQSTVRAR
jgi:mannose-1-phosphate guanylyltransferase / phosphomannomutase